MNQALTKSDRLDQQRKYATKLIDQIKPTAYPINVKLVNNPFLKSEDKFQFIVYQLNQYNKQIQKGHINDPYEMASYHKLHSMVSDLAQIDTRKDQKEALNKVHEWFKDQHRLVQQRKDQGDIRYVITNNYRKYMRLPPQEKQKTEQPTPKYEIPTDLVDRLLEPYYLENRTIHKELEVPIRRINQYKRKVINIAPFIDTRDEKVPDRVLYPMPPKYQAPKQQGDELKQGEVPAQIKQGEQTNQLVLDADGKPIEGTGAQNKQQAVPQQDIGGGFGEEPEEPEDQEPEEVDDKLGPKNKLFTAAVTNIAPQRHYR